MDYELIRKVVEVRVNVSVLGFLCFGGLIFLMGIGWC